MNIFAFIYSKFEKTEKKSEIYAKKIKKTLDSPKKV